jgi:hypothetical protein
MVCFALFMIFFSSDTFDASIDYKQQQQQQQQQQGRMMTLPSEKVVATQKAIPSEGGSSY